MERLAFGWDFEVDAWSRFWKWNSIKIYCWTCDMNSTLWSVVPLAMFDYTCRKHCDEFLIQALICKNTGGVRAHFLPNYERCMGKIRALTVKYSIFQKRIAKLLNNAIRPLNSPSRPFKLELSTSDLLCCQGGSEYFICARNYEKVKNMR